MNPLKLLNRQIRQKNYRAARLFAKKYYFRFAKPYYPDPIFIVGCSRSGTTVTFETISAAKELTSFGFELPQFWNSLVGPATNNWHSESASGENATPNHRIAAQAHFYANVGSKRLVDKTCINVMRIPYLLKLFPEARFVYIYRDGPDNVSSLIDGWRDGRFELRQFLGDFPEKVNINNGEFDVWHFFLPPGWREHNQDSLENVCAYQWETANRMALEAKALVPSEQWIELRYEDIFVDPITMYGNAFDRLKLDFDKEIESRCASLASRPTSIVQGMPQKEKWRKHNPIEVGRIINIINPLRKELGYNVD